MSPSPPNLCAQAWTHREEILYPALFGWERRGIFPLLAEMFTGLFNQPDFDANWTRCAAWEFGPTEKRASWLYVTSGMSNAWNATQPESGHASGLGCEFVLETPFRASWAVARLHYLMAFQFLAGRGLLPDRQPIKAFDQVELGTSIGSEESALTWIMLAPPTGFPPRHQLATGWFEFAQVVGISAAEATAARIHGGPLLWQGLQREGAFPVTAQGRKSIV